MGPALRWPRCTPACPTPIFGSSAPPRLAGLHLVLLSLAVAAVAGLTAVTQPNQLVTNAAARDESAARFGMVSGSVAKRICTVLWGFGGLIAILLYAGSLRNSDLVWGLASRDWLGPLNLGLVGLMLVGMLSALMAVSNSLMLTMSGLITANLYRPLRPGKSERHYIAVGRAAGVLFLAGSALIATQFDTLFDLLKFTWEFFTIFSGAFWLGLKWRRANRAGRGLRFWVTAAVLYVIPLGLPALFPGLRSNARLGAGNLSARRHALLPGESRRQSGPGSAASVALDLWSQGVASGPSGRQIGRGYPYLDLLLLQAVGFDLRRNATACNETIRIVIRLFLPFGLLIAVASLTARDEAGLVDRFFVKMRTRVSVGGGLADSASLAIALQNPNHLRETKVFPDSDWEIYRWSRKDAVGFAFAIGLVFAILGLLEAVASYSGR